MDRNREATDQPVVDTGALEDAGHDEQRVEEVRGHPTTLEHISYPRHTVTLGLGALERSAIARATLPRVKDFAPWAGAAMSWSEFPVSFVRSRLALYSTRKTPNALGVRRRLTVLALLLGAGGCRPAGAGGVPPNEGPIEAIESAEQLCIRRAGWLHCGYGHWQLQLVDAGRVRDHADGYDLTFVDEAGVVWRRELARNAPIPAERRWRYRKVDFDAPAQRLGAHRGTVCATQGAALECRSLDQPARSTLHLPAGAGSITSIDVDAWDGPDIVVLDDAGSVFASSWTWGRAEAPVLRRVDLPPVVRFDRGPKTWAAATADGAVLFGSDLSNPQRVSGLPTVRDVTAMPNGFCAATARGVVCRGYDGGFALAVEPFGSEYIVALDASQIRPELRDDLRLIERHGSGLCVANETDAWCTLPIYDDQWGPQRLPVVFEEATSIVSGGDFACARHGDDVSCAGPSFGPFAATEPMPEASGADALFAGEHALCARFGTELRCWARVVAPDESGAWARRERIDLDTDDPRSLRVGDEGVAWTHEDRVVQLRTARSKVDARAAWLLDPESIARSFERTTTPLTTEVLEQRASIEAYSGRYVLMRDGKVRTFGERALTLCEAGLLTLFTGGLGLLAAPILRIDTSTEHAALPQTVELAAGAEHLCMRNRTGTVGCFGANAGGQVNGRPDGAEYASDAAPYEVPLEQPASMLSAGREHTCALLEDRTVRCWGWWGPRQVASRDDRSAWERVALD